MLLSSQELFHKLYSYRCHLRLVRFPTLVGSSCRARGAVNASSKQIALTADPMKYPRVGPCLSSILTLSTRTCRASKLAQITYKLLR